MKKVLLSVAAIALAGSLGNAVAGDAAAGKAKSAVCVACHGANGMSTNPIYPNLAGQHAAYIESSLKAYKSGERKGGMSAVMSPMAMPLTDADIANLAAYYSSLGK
jgi:cytochrome c553